MEVLKVLLIDTVSETRKLLERKPSANGEAIRLNVTRIGTKVQAKGLSTETQEFDLILFGEKVSSLFIVQATKSFRNGGITSPILMLSETSLQQRFKAAGVDDVINIADLRTPIFLWTLKSTLKQIEERRKAQEFDLMQQRLLNLSKSIAFITHEINNPLSIIRLALYHLENPKLAKGRKEVFFKLLSENVDKVGAQMRELYTIRRILGADPKSGNSSSSAKSIEQALLAG